MTAQSPAVRAAVITAVLLVGLAVAIPAFAGGAGKVKWWQAEWFVRRLELTPEQSAKIEKIFQAGWSDLQKHKADLDRLEDQLSAMIAEGSTSEVDIIQQIDRVEASRSAMGRARSLMLYRMHRVLTPEQREKLKALQKEWEREKHKSSSEP